MFTVYTQMWENYNALFTVPHNLNFVLKKFCYQNTVITHFMLGMLSMRRYHAFTSLNPCKN